jgi:hypothetical protein
MKLFIAKMHWMPKRAAWQRHVGTTHVAGDGRLNS